jgi:hypothetical protein
MSVYTCVDVVRMNLSRTSTVRRILVPAMDPVVSIWNTHVPALSTAISVAFYPTHSHEFFNNLPTRRENLTVCRI